MTHRRQRALISLVAAVGGWLAAAGVAAAPAIASHTPDFIGERMEVTQGTQDLNNSVPLVSGKRTFVRFYARVDGGPQVQPTNAVLVAQKPSGESTVLLPLNPGGQVKVVKRGPIEQTGWLMRLASGDGNGAPALFELPANFRQGTVTLTAAINPQICFFPPCTPTEHNTANNVATTQAAFSAVPQPKVSVHRVRYSLEGKTTFDTALDDVYGMISWLVRAYPVPRVGYGVSLLDWGDVILQANGNGHPDIFWPSCTKLNSRLLQIEGLEQLASEAFAGDFIRRVYGMIDDGGGFMRGCASEAPGFVASGPTGVPGANVNPADSSTWDFDGSYGDYYGGHELAHTYGRQHANFCGAEGGVPYPYPAGRISPDFTFGNQSSIVAQIFGFDIATRDVYGPHWHDLMTYCDREWVSDFTVEGLRDAFLAAGAAGGGSPASGEDVDGEAGPLLWVVATVNPGSLGVDLEPTFAVDPARPVDVPDRGDFAVVLQDERGRELARHSVRAVPEHPGPPAYPDRPSREFERLRIATPVPLAEGARRLVIEGPGGRVLKSVRPGAATPSVELTSPRGEESFADGSVEVSWTASDRDGDSLTYLAQYRPSEEADWRSVALPTDARRVEVPFSNLPAGGDARFRVLATDGLHTAVAESEPFEVVNRPPELEIVSPRDGDSFVGDVALPDFDGLGQPVALEARAHDADTGAIEEVQWTSSLDGPLGIGVQLTVDGLSAGQHTITAIADDGNGGRSTATVEITVVDHPGDLPPSPDAIEVEPREVVLWPAAAADRAELSVFERNLGEVGWRAETTAPWLALSAERGVTSAPLEVALRPDLLPRRADTASARIVVTSPDLGSRAVTVPVEVQLEPLERRSGG
jgi:hypothetical protein